ncbi:DUF1766-domain-containing protein [Lepidopterella palustris CBS 459.81]|uniref:DUF1766-domain-containing protein n=1 Tax=Lepidopterella palustris CBS 459.81 TaxID=1314670 RepID=A0A8E2E7F8_9PEZI|nr:DUF1766-domain-containing protein [Lepidopterella palustris CBS 459.81]
MPFIPHTPEALLPRSDSKNPATTCKGITSSGRPCRRIIAAAKSPRESSALATSGVLAVVSVGSNGEEDRTGTAAFFCWQHKDQAEQLAANNSELQDEDATKLVPLQERTSIDTLVARLGVVEIADPKQDSSKAEKKRRSESHNSTGQHLRRTNLPPTWDKVQGPLMSVPEDLMAAEVRRTSQKPRPSRPSPRKQKQPSFWAALCCFGTPDEDYVEVVKHKRRVQGHASPGTSQPVPVSTSTLSNRPSHGIEYSSNERPERPRPRPTSQPHAQSQGNTVPARRPLGEKLARPINKTISSGKSETETLLSYIPKSLSPQITSILLTELSKPISQYDEEGYIYIFWLTPESTGLPPSTAAASLLEPPSKLPTGRRTSDVLLDYAARSAQTQPSSKTIPGAWSTEPASIIDKKTILLKIGRASNVHRRMNEWTRQCGYSLSLVRFYPYVPSSPSPSPSPAGSPANSRRPSLQPPARPADPVRRVSENAGVRKVPHAHRVERLIHIELAEQRVRMGCEACGKEHREWFEVEASRRGVKAVDEVVRRWVDWAERAGGEAR